MGNRNTTIRTHRNCRIIVDTARTVCDIAHDYRITPVIDQYPPPINISAIAYPVCFSRMSEMTQAYSNRPSGNCRATTNIDFNFCYVRLTIRTDLISHLSIESSRLSSEFQNCSSSGAEQRALQMDQKSKQLTISRSLFNFSSFAIFSNCSDNNFKDAISQKILVV